MVKANINLSNEIFLSKYIIDGPYKVDILSVKKGMGYVI